MLEDPVNSNKHSSSKEGILDIDPKVDFIINLLKQEHIYEEGRYFTTLVTL